MITSTYGLVAAETHLQEYTKRGKMNMAKFECLASPQIAWAITHRSAGEDKSAANRIGKLLILLSSKNEGIWLWTGLI
jgi:hypothetical protein